MGCACSSDPGGHRLGVYYCKCPFYDANVRRYYGSRFAITGPSKHTPYTPQRQAHVPRILVHSPQILEFTYIPT